MMKGLMGIDSGWAGVGQVCILRRDCLGVAKSMIDDLREEILPKHENRCKRRRRCTDT